MEYPVTLMEREDSDHLRRFVYHGPEARQKVTIHVYWHSGEFPDFAFAVQDDQVLEAFRHPYAYEYRSVAAQVGPPGFAPESRHVTGTRRFSQAISEGDGISIVVPVDDPESARAAEEQGAEALVLNTHVESIREATSLPLLWRPHGSHDQALAAEADACVLAFAELADETQLEHAYRSALELGLECRRRSAGRGELEAALERVDPEIFLLAAGRTVTRVRSQRASTCSRMFRPGSSRSPSCRPAARDEVAELERAGMDAVIVPGGNVAELVGGSRPRRLRRQPRRRAERRSGAGRRSPSRRSSPRAAALRIVGVDYAPPVRRSSAPTSRASSRAPGTWSTAAGSTRTGSTTRRC